MSFTMLRALYLGWRYVVWTGRREEEGNVVGVGPWAMDGGRGMGMQPRWGETSNSPGAGRRGAHRHPPLLPRIRVALDRVEAADADVGHAAALRAGE